LTNGNYVVRSPFWDNPAGPTADVGAVTWCSGTTGCSGAVTPSNSLVGGTASDVVGSVGVTPLTNGNYVVRSPLWDNPAGPTADVGAVTWCSGTTGCSGAVTPSNSLVGGTATDGVGNSGVTPLTNGNYVVFSPFWDNPAGPIANARAVTLGNGLGGTVGLITSANSVLGTVSNGISGFSQDYARNRLFVGRGASNMVSILYFANADLSNLVLSSGTLTPVFATGTLNYTANVESSVTSITVTPTAADTTATIKVNNVVVASGAASGAINLTVGANTITMVVTAAQDGTTTKTYTVTVTRAPSSNANLSNLGLSSGTLSPVFASGTQDYTATVTDSVTSITVTPTASDSTATIQVNGVAVTSGTASGAINLNVGANTITTLVTAQDGTTTKTYTVTVTRAAFILSLPLILR
jgi:hypothetical protein